MLNSSLSINVALRYSGRTFSASSLIAFCWAAIIGSPTPTSETAGSGVPISSKFCTGSVSINWSEVISISSGFIFW